MNDTVSENIQKRSKLPEHRGAIFQMEADQQGQALVEAKEGSVKIYTTVNPDTSTVQEARFFTYGGPAFTAVADALCEILEGITAEEIRKITPADVELKLRDAEDIEAMPADTPALRIVEPLLLRWWEEYPTKKSLALEMRSRRERDGETAKALPDDEWFHLTDEERRSKIDECLDNSIRAVLQGDGGDLEVLDLVEKTKVMIRYVGACNSCGASTGGTLFYIENQLRQDVYAGLSVEPENDPFGDPVQWT